MPSDLYGLDEINQLIEYRGIRGGEMGERHPIKTMPIVRMPLKNKNNRFDVDEKIMLSAARREGHDHWAGKVDKIPVYLFTDNILGDAGVVYIERALYSRRGRLCGSMGGIEAADRRVDVNAYAKNKKIVELPKPIEVPCNEDCPMWGSPTEKTDCHWRAVVTVQLQDSPVYPSPTRYRTTSKYSIRALLTSLRFISSITGGVMTGIPLNLVQRKIEVFDADRKKRLIPVMFFEFPGTLQKLREFAVAELKSRETLKQAIGGEFSIDVNQTFVDLQENVEEEGDIEEVEETGLADLSSEIAKLGKQLGFTRARMQMLEEKHQGDLDAMLGELQMLSPDFDPSAGEPVLDDDLDDIFD